MTSKLSTCARIALLVGVLAAPSAGARTIEWSGRTWRVRSATAASGPGPNYFSDGPSSVWVDAAGLLHLRVARSGGRWRCAEVFLDAPMGHGAYAFHVETDVSNLDRQAVLGLFTYRDDAHEIDVEFARWGDARDPTNAQYVVQPYAVAGNLQRWTLPPDTTNFTATFQWGVGGVAFETTTPTGAVVHRWTYAGASTPAPDAEVPHLNLWLYQGRAPASGRPVEVVIRSFSFVP
jgi:hypothetical protein